jgi:hypothetical protein
LIFTKLGVVLVFGLGISAMNNLDFDGGILEALGRLLSGTVLMLISAFVPIVAFKFFGFLGEQAVDSLHAGASAGVQRSREVVGQLSPNRVMERVNGHAPAGQSANGHGRSSNGSGPQTTQQATTAQQRRYHEGRPRQSTSTRPAAAGARNGGSGGAAASGSRAGGAAGGAAAAASGAAGAVVGASAVAAEKVRWTGQQSVARAAADDPYMIRDPNHAPGKHTRQQR